ncbi:hypothetical protein JRO89_XS10G0036700 [Xanthoceras sorbifolium]|uniref:NB-ARC domain-containing protein n=1 Tax=Xanthoceras sorbifolium TaxID=99658 RepID=A0ABQ8HHG4_9ROSI|nr:hypothetical protein JRO89_XS10G0036700 [Xanthoceras sorbifolium]
MIYVQVLEKVRLVVGVDEEVQRLTNNFQAIESVLEDIECKQDVLDEWNTAIQKLRIMEAENASKLVIKNMLENIKESIKDKKFLLVLDDEWTGDSNEWEQLKSSLKYDSKGSKILVITRKINVAKVMGSTNFIEVGMLSEKKNVDKFHFMEETTKRDYIRIQRNKVMKLVREEYFEKLAMPSFFEDFERDIDDDSIIEGKIHDMVHDFALYLNVSNEKALEHLQPPPNSESLDLRGYRGTSHLFLNWMTSLTKQRPYGAFASYREAVIS